MMRRHRLRFWLTVCDLAERFRLPRGVWLWCVAKASDATEWIGVDDEQAWRDAGCPKDPPW